METNVEPIEITYEQEDSVRVDQFLSQHFEISRADSKALIKDGFVKLNGKKTKPSESLSEGDRLEVVYNKKERSSESINLKPAPMDLDILFEDEHLAIINKPAGVVVHPGAGTKETTLIEGFLHYLENKKNASSLPGEEERPGIVHRLDKDTSGIMVLAKSDLAMKKLSDQFRDKTNLREYVCLMDGVPKTTETTVETYLYRDTRHRIKFASMSEEDFLMKQSKTDKELTGYRYAKSSFFVKRVYGNRLALSVVRLSTGRTHQIRLHSKEIARGIVGDKLYYPACQLSGSFPNELRAAVENAPRQLLHARKLGIIHPVSGKKIAFEAPIPEDFRKIVDLLEKFSKKA